MSLARIAVALSFLGASTAGQQLELQIIAAPPPPDGNPTYNFDVGGAVAISDEWMAVADRTVTNATGDVYMYRRTPSGWAFRQRLTGEFQSGFGVTLAIEGNTLVVGGEIWNGYLGKAYVFEWTGAAWTKIQELLPDGLLSVDWPAFGKSVALCGNVLVIGAHGVDHPVENAGEIRVYERSGAAWELVARFQLPPAPPVLNQEHLRLGASVAVLEDVIVAGAPGKFGAAYVYERSASGWSPAAVLANPSPAIGDDFGASVDIDGSTIVVGRPHFSSVSPRVGRAFVYERNGSGGWNLARDIRASDGYVDGDRGDLFGRSVAIIGDRIVVGASRGRFNGSSTGTVYLFGKGVSGWPETEDVRLVASDSSGQSDFLGVSVAMYGGFIVAGAVGGWHEGIREGKAYAFSVELGDAHCTPSESSATLGVTGSKAAPDRDLTLTIRGAPASVRGLFLLSASLGSVPFGNDFLCLGAPVLRVAYALTGQEGAALHDLDFDTAWLAGQLVSGSTWYFQFAHDRHAGAGHIDVLTNAVSLTLQ